MLRRISLHEFPCRHKLEMANTLAEFLNGFRLPLELEDCRKSFAEIVVPGNRGKRLGRSLPWREILHLSRATSYCLPATHNLRKIFRIKNKQGPFPGRTPVSGVITPSTIL